MKKISLVYFVVIISFAFAQYENFDLKTFTFPEIKTQSLDMQIFGNNQYYYDYDAPENESSDPQIRNRFDNHNSLMFRYELNHESRYFQRKFNATLDLDYVYSKSQTQTYKNVIHDFYPSIDLEINNRHFFAKDYFFETDLETDLFHRCRNRTDFRYRDSLEFSEKYRLLNNTISIPIKIGKGRIDRIDDARRAIYIIEALTDIGKIKQKLSDEEIIEFATLISELRLRRVFDSRLSHMANIENLDAFLRSKGYITTPDIKYYINLEDMWRYGHDISRYKGKQISFGVIPGLQGTKSADIEDETYNNNKIYSMDIGIDYIYQNPINLYKQDRFRAFVYSGINRSFHNSSSDTLGQIYHDVNIKAGLEYTKGYYPNSRTYINFTNKIYYLNVFGSYDEDFNLIRECGHVFYGSMSASLKYYISPRLSLNANLGLIAHWIKSDTHIQESFPFINSFYYQAGTIAWQIDEHFIYPNFNMSIDYSIF